MHHPEREAKGEQGERDLRAWFDLNRFAHVAIRQDDKTFAHLFRKEVKRPDFLLLVDSIGLLAVDAKFCARCAGGTALPLEADFSRALMFERIFRLPVWYAYRGDDASTWYWISALKAFQVAVRRRPEDTYLQVELKHFVCLRSSADFGLLYTERLPGFQNIRPAGPSTAQMQGSGGPAKPEEKTAGRAAAALGRFVRTVRNGGSRGGDGHTANDQKR